MSSVRQFAFRTTAERDSPEIRVTNGGTTAAGACGRSAAPTQSGVDGDRPRRGDPGGTVKEIRHAQLLSSSPCGCVIAAAIPVLPSVLIELRAARGRALSRCGLDC
jgi:hypothetical protein